MTNSGHGRVAFPLSMLAVVLTAVLSLGLMVPCAAEAQVSSLPIDFSDVVVFGTNSVRLWHHTQIVAGHVVVNNASPGPTLGGTVELDIDRNVVTPAGYAIVADSIDVANFAVVNGNAFYNSLSNSGTINGSLNTPLSLPVFTPLPPFQTASPGTLDVTVPDHQVQTLAPGNYRDIVVQEFATLKFSPGVYNIRSISTGRNVKLLFQNLTSGPADVRVQNQAIIGNFSVVGPDDGDPLKASKIIFYVGFTSGSSLTPAAFSVGSNTALKANVYAPNGTLLLNEHVTATGAFLGRDVRVEHDTQVDLETFFGQQAPTITSADATTFTLGQNGTFTVTTTGTPPISITRGGVALPSAVTFVDNGDGTGTLSGIPASGTAGTYAITFTATNAAGSSPAQNFTLIVAKASQTISFTSAPPAGATVGGPTYNVTATATSGLTVSFTIDASASSVCSVAGSAVSFIGAGTCVINANQAGNADYNPAPQVQQSFAVGQGSQTITFTSVPPATPTVGGPTYTVTATATSGLTVVFTIDASASSVCSITGSTVSFIGNGTCVINANQPGNANYSAAPQVQQSFTVKSAQTITFTSSPPATPTVGGPTYNVTATATSGLTVTFTIDASASTVCSIVGSTVSFGPNAGTCVINANQAGDANFYPAPQVQQSFTVKKSQTITFTSAAPNPAFYQGPTYNVTATATSGLTVTFTIDASASTVCSIAGSTVSFIGTGTCVINANQAGDANFYPAPQVQQSFAVHPSVGNDAYNALGNVLVDSSNGLNTPFSVTDNDNAPAGATISAFDAVSTQGGTVTMTTSGANLGRFTYNPPVGFTGTDTFTYTLSSNGRTAVGTVTFTVSGKVWFINNNAGACSSNCDGRLTNPYVDVSNFQADNLAGVAPKPTANDAIFVYGGGSNYSGALILLNGQRLVGQGAAGTLATLGNVTIQNGQALAATGGTSPVLTSAGIVLTVGSGNFVHGLTLGNGTAALVGSGFGTLTASDNVVISTGGRAVSLTNGTLGGGLNSVTSTGGTTNIALSNVGTSGTFGFGSGALSGATLDALTIDGQNGSFTYSGTISNAGAGRAVNILNKTGGTVTLSGDINPAAAGRGILVQGNSTGTNTITFSGASKKISTGTTAGVNVATNTGATINFSNGGLDITTSTATGFNATGGGTVTVTTGANPNTITSGTGTALNVVSTTIGGSGLTFRSISANGGTNGIVLSATGAGGLTVTGTGTTDGSGGTIQNITTNGASFTSANNISLSNMTFTNAGSTDGGGAGVCDGNTNAGCHAAINLSTVSHVSLTNVDISGGAEQGINGQNVTHLTLADSTIQNVGNAVNEHGIYIRGLFGTVAGGTVNSISNTTVTNAGNHNVFILTSTATNAFPGQPDRLELTNSTFSNPGSAVPSDGVTVAVRGTANFQTVVTGSTFSRVTSACCDGIQVDAGDTSHSDVTITGSTITGPWGQSAINLSGANTSVTTFNISNNPTITGGLGQGINVASNNDSTLNGTIANNPNITTAQANNAGQGIWVLVDSGGQTVVDIDTNTITNFSSGIVAGARNTPQGTADITIRNSTVTNGGNFASYGVWVFSGNGSGGETNRTCLNLSNNNVSISPLGIVEYAFEQYAGTTLQLQGFVGSGTSATDVTNYVDARDIGATSVDPDGLSGFLSVTAATCAVP